MKTYRPEKEDTPYIVLESIRNDKNNSRYVHTIVAENKKEFILGRGHESDLRVNDISVSRVHVKITYSEEEGHFVLEDRKSKFGTLVLLKGPLDIEPGFNRAVQVGRSVIHSQVKVQKTVSTRSSSRIEAK